MSARVSFWGLLVSALCLTGITLVAGGVNYKHFDVAIYCRVYEVREMKDPAYLERTWAAVSKHMKVDKIYLGTQPKYFDGVYTGTETRDPIYSNQHLQQYLGYSIFRYFENLKPGGNGGGWVDPGGLRSLDR